MERSLYDITLDIQATHARVGLTVKRFDTHRRLRFRLVSGGRPYPLTDDCYAVFTAQKPDGTEIFNHCTREGSHLLYDLTPQTTAVPGLLNCELRLYGADDALLTSAAFTITVADTVYPNGDGEITSTGEATALTRLVSQAGEHIAQMGDMVAYKAATDDALAGLAQADKAHETRLTALETGIGEMEAAVDAKVAAMEENAEANAARLEASVDAKAAQLEAAVADRIAAVAVIDDAAVGTDAWSSRQITVDRAPAIVQQASGSHVTVQDSAAAPLAGLTLCGKTTQNGVPTPAAPVALENVGSSGQLRATIRGKNLADPAVLRAASGITESGGVFTGTVSVLYNATKTGALVQEAFAEGQQYVFSMWAKKSDASATPYLAIRYTDGDSHGINITATDDFTRFVLVSKPGKTVERMTVDYGTGGNATLSVKDIQVELGTEVTDYEAYTAQTLVVETPNGLPGVPVASDGNYTDETGQQWICDTVDFARGVHVKRTATVDMGALTWGIKAAGVFYSWGLQTLMGAGVLCDKYAVGSAGEVYERQTNDMAICVGGNPGYRFIGLANSNYTDAAALKASLSGTTLLYALAEPVETLLSSEALSAYRALHTNCPNTTVSSDAGLQLSYVADTKTYIDQRFRALESAILSTGGNV